MYKTIYIPLDNSDYSNMAIEVGTTLAKQCGATLVGSHAYAVIGYNSSNQTITLYNPWGPNYATVTMTWARSEERRVGKECRL